MTDPRHIRTAVGASDTAGRDGMIGQYVTSARLTRAHLVESVIDDEPVTRCGRRLRKREGTTFRYEATPARQVCAGCQP